MNSRFDWDDGDTTTKSISRSGSLDDEKAEKEKDNGVDGKENAEKERTGDGAEKDKKDGGQYVGGPMKGLDLRPPQA
ncbi:hypothetical protein AB6A40_008370 [Gnathostoma spinigerum]|uniref:Uncharacterized protein n=1 Tax=Gnathostoma spinigerum TaxID=75299 RepID=A0ABD6EQT2_9BILA